MQAYTKVAFVLNHTSDVLQECAYMLIFFMWINYYLIVDNNPLLH